MLEKRLIIIGGKGGVGRTTIAASLAIALAERGRRVLLAHVRCERCERQLERLLGAKRVDDKIRVVHDNLWVTNMNPRAALLEMGDIVLRFRAISRAVLENRIVRGLLRAIPGLDDYSMIGKAWYHTTELDDDGRPRFDTVVFDGPATGHLISMLRIPQVILDAVPDGPLTTDARALQSLLADPDKTAMLIVTLAEEMPVSEATDLYRAATDDLAIALAGLVINQLYPDDITRDDHLAETIERLAASSAEESDALHHLTQAADTLRRHRQINDRYLSHLAETIPEPHLHLPNLFSPNLDRSALTPLIHAFDELLGGSAR